MQSIAALIVDDERLARKRLRSLLKTETDIEVIGECATGREALEQLRSGEPDLMFLDVQMPELDGMSVVKAIEGGKAPLIVFVTAYDDYAIQAFEIDAVDYLLKPFDQDRFRKTLNRVRARLLEGRPFSETRLAELLEKFRPRQPERIAIRNGSHLVVLETGAIDWIEAADNYVCLHCGPETHVMRETMNSLEQLLDASRFARIHRSAMVNLDRIKQMQPWFRGDYRIILQDGTTLTLSRNYRERLQSRFLRWA